MTLIAAFRCRNNGILLCADRQEDDGVAIRPFDKIYRIGELTECQILIAGSGLSGGIRDAWTEIHQSFVKASKEQRDIVLEHRSIIEESLRRIHIRHKEDLKSYPLGLIFVTAPRIPNSAPILYRSDRSNLIPEMTYISYGSGKTISDYFADRLYTFGLPNDLLAVLATFIFREAEKSSSGVGLGNDMVFIHPGGSLLTFLYTDAVKEIEAGIPSLTEAMYSYWATHVKKPEWLKDNYADSAESK